MHPPHRDKLIYKEQKLWKIINCNMDDLGYNLS